LPAASESPGSWRSMSRSSGILIAAGVMATSRACSTSLRPWIGRNTVAGSKRCWLRPVARQYPSVVLHGPATAPTPSDVSLPPSKEAAVIFLPPMAGNQKVQLYHQPWSAWHFLSGVWRVV
jgi:hypothetical protein